MTSSSTLQAPEILYSSAGKGWDGLDAALVNIPRGLARIPGRERHTLGLHYGPPVNADCTCDGKRLRRVQKQGDIGFVPAGMDSSWEDDAACQILRLSLPQSLVDRVAADLDKDATTIALVPHMQLRDARIEAIGWAIKAELEADTPSDPLYIDHLASALVIRLFDAASDNYALPQQSAALKLSARQLKLLTDFIEQNLDQQLHVAHLATVAGLGATRLKLLFRNSTGMSVHQYVIRRRVEHARTLIATTKMPASEIALASGFAHQSHMTTTMRRILGQTPGAIARPASKI
jgi:AraC family transcriptional regulator